MMLEHKLDAGAAIVLDGAVGSEIARLGGGLHQAAWCGVANVTHPDIVRQVHASYLEAGADVITANTFATCRHVLSAADLGDRCGEVTGRAVLLAREAIDVVEPGRPVAVAGSMSNTLAWRPGTYHADPRFKPTLEQEEVNYREMAETLAEAGVDVIITEMMLDVTRASLVTQAALDTGLPVWVGVSCSLIGGPVGGDHDLNGKPAGRRLTGWDMRREEPADRLDDGERYDEPEDLRTIIDALARLEPSVMGIMHSQVAAMDAGLAMLQRLWDGPVMAYPEATEEHSMTPETFADHGRRWVDGGVNIIGGCCGTTVEHIRALVARLRKA